MKINFYTHDITSENLPNEGVVVIAFNENKELCVFGQSIDQKLAHFLTHILSSFNQTDKMDDPIILRAPKGLDNVSHVVLVKKCDDYLELGGKLAACINGLKKEKLTLLMDEQLSAENAAALAYGYKLRSWSFDKYLTTENRKKVSPTSITIHTQSPKDAQKVFETLDHIYESVVLTRELVSEPGNIIYPKTLADRMKELEKEGLTVEIFDTTHLKKMGFNALLGVAQGSINEARLVVLTWNGGKKDDAPFAIVGKGVTFDSGGISIKPSSKMEDMKWDMGGSAVVAGLLHAVAKNNVKANVVGVMGLVENMPSGSAQRPGDIVTSLSGQTIEVINTDAEGRLVLADALWYTQERFKPKYMVDLATLTGAIIVGLGHRYAGLFGNDQDLINQIKKASDTTKEKVWHLPLDKEFAKALKADQADLRNADYGVGAGSIMAAQFLECFVNKTPWAHLDIAGTAWSNKTSFTHDKGATGYGVRLLYQWIQDNL